MLLVKCHTLLLERMSMKSYATFIRKTKDTSKQHDEAFLKKVQYLLLFNTVKVKRTKFL